ncbi:ABC transporter permease [Streptomyces sp. DSM 44915]|uniref:ABC transporter permease n=1 Tax=Streptomyces chisholmiae TaxID=3075540 RepID=A0ABU2JYQ7_9ACTN|nr:ABC transporter permease [Streptomyces sp. DSM 44915]
MTSRDSPYLPALVISLVLAVAAGLFAGSYSYAMANPTPHTLQVAVLARPADAGPRLDDFLRALEWELDTTIEARAADTYQQAVDEIEEQRVFAVVGLAPDGRLGLDLAGAAGASVAELLERAAPRAAEATGNEITVRDIKPLHSGDPRGLALFYMNLAAVICGFLGAIQLSVNARRLRPGERIVVIAGYSLLGGLCIVAAVDWLLAAVPLPFPLSWLILAATMFTAGMVFTMFNTLFGRWAVLPTWALLVLLGNPSSGGAVSWPLLPSAFGTIGRWLPPGASVSAQHTAVYFHGHQHLHPYLVLAGWSALSCVVFWTWRHRHPGGR